MAASNRSALLTQSHKVLKKHFKPVTPPERTVLDNLLFSCCLENSTHEAAEAVYATIGSKFFDLNEVRVSTHRELAEHMKGLADPTDAAVRLRGVLQSVFESIYDFDLEALKKLNIGQAVKALLGYAGVTSFAAAYVTQTSLGGHSIPVNQGAMRALRIVGIVSEKEAAQQSIPGMERAISKNKGIEYGSLLHQLGVMLAANPYAPAVRQVLLEINPDCKSQLPKRVSKKAAQAAEKVASKAKSKSKSVDKAASVKKKTSKKAAPAKKVAKKKASSSKKKTVKRTEKNKSKKGVTPTKRLSKRKPR